MDPPVLSLIFATVGYDSAMSVSEVNSNVPTSHPVICRGRVNSTLLNRRDRRIRPKPIPPSRGNHRVTSEFVWSISESFRGTTPRIGSCSR